MAKTIVFIHGARVTPSCWDLFKRRYEARGYSGIAPAWPFDARPVAELQRHPAPGLAAYTMPFKAFQWGFAHTQPPAAQRAAHDTQIVPTPGRVNYQLLLGIHTAVIFKNHRRTPLLLIGGELDRTATAGMTPTLFRRHWAWKAVTAYKEFGGRTHGAHCRARLGRGG